MGIEFIDIIVINNTFIDCVYPCNIILFDELLRIAHYKKGQLKMNFNWPCFMVPDEADPLRYWRHRL
jgi:hypothetical protein